ncbi:McrB family protein [Pseudoalteromonas tetraodonis]|uniref:McrB family protein n=2 Tax=Pseudoalteromonas TaxID=53246 RepID=UPI0039890277
MPRDFTKYNFNGQILGKGRLVLAVIKEFVKQNQPTLAELFKAFPVEVQGRKGLFCTEQEFNEKLKTSDDVKKRFFTKDDEILDIEGTKVLVSTQWGEGNIADFIGQAESQGFYITELERDELSGVTRIWKVSHSPNSINTEQRMWLEENSLLAVHKNTGNGSVPCFEQMSKGDIVSLGYGNQVVKIVKVISDIETQADSPLGNDWLLRSYETIKGLPAPIKYKGKHKRWSPRFNGTSWEVPKNEYWMFEEEILQPYYALTLKDLGFDSSQISRPTNLSSSVEVMNTVSLNQILYGPPGTGKTYHSIQAAVKAAEPEIFSALGINESSGATPEQRAELTRLYKELYNAGRIRFVTFHQSYGYEEFVEGLSAKTEGDQLSYFEKDGVFKSLCLDAKEHQIAKTKTVASTFEDKWQGFSEELAEAEDGIKIDTLSKKTYFTVTDITNNTIRFDKSKGASVHSLSVKTLRAVHNGEKEIKGGLQPYYGAVIEYLNKFKTRNDAAKKERKNFVLIIDEINRGNISKIFGELITLIEPSKRLGQPEAIEVTLPYSGDKFSVPDNLYIIGTMNTADRSLALMDTALRRRFDFIEMMPDYNVLHNEEGSSFKVESDGFEIDLARLLETMNKRIAALYDREHQLGHAFLMPVVKAIAAGDDEKALHELKSCFQNKIIPLLAEYFFEDWQKIRLVVGDNQKPEAYQLINQSDVDYEVLFGDTEDVGDVADEVQDFRLIKSDSERWTDPLTYIGIYSAGSLTFSNQDEG